MEADSFPYRSFSFSRRRLNYRFRFVAFMQSFRFYPAVARWFEQTLGSPTEPQARGWPAIQSGRHVLISAPTGSGKTLAAFLASLDILFREGMKAELPDETQVVYVSPLKALSNDIRKNLQEPLAGIRALLQETEGRPPSQVYGAASEIDVRAEVRTGDTTAAQRQALIKKPPHILVTTPESLYLLLTSESGRRMLSTVRTLILDEIHAVVDDRRGAHLALSIERLAALTSWLNSRAETVDIAASFVGTCLLYRVGQARTAGLDTVPGWRAAPGWSGTRATSGTTSGTIRCTRSGWTSPSGWPVSSAC